MDKELLAKYGQAVPRYTSYPTAPHFHAGVGPADYEAWLQALPRATPLSLYLHIPFCDSLCWFCGCHTKVVRRYGPVAAYLDALRCEIALVADALGAPRPLSHLHFGGGSPTILKPDDVATLAGLLFDRFAALPDLELSVEIDPRDIDRDGVRAWAEAGMTRASLGVQDFDPEVQRAVNRTQSLACTARAVGWLRASDVRQINMDLIYGLPHQSVERVIATLRKVLTLAPDRLALFGYAHVPWMKRHQRLIPEDALPGPAERVAQNQAASQLLREAGYRRIGLDHFARPEDPLARAQEAGELRRNFQGYTSDDSAALIGVGASAIGRLPQGYLQNAVPIRDYAAAVGSGRLAVTRGLALGPEDRLRGEVIERLMCDFSVDLAEQASKYGLEASVFGGEIAALRPMARDGLVAIDGFRVKVTDRGRALVRTVCAQFDSYLATGEARHSRAV